MERETSPFFINNFIQKRSFIKMSNLTTEVFGDMNYLYEHIANKDAQQLNENSDYYDEEFAELVEDIISTISLSMVYEGYSANGIISFLANSPNEDIIEKYLNFDENVITESVISEDYIVEQLDQLNEFVGAALRILGAGLKAAKYAKGVKGIAPVARLASGFKGAGTAAERVAKQGLKQSSVVRSTISKGVQKVKDIAKGAKTALTSPTAKKIGLGALGAGALVGLPYAGAKLAGAGSGGQGPSPTGGKATNVSNADFTKGSALAKLGGREGRIKDGEFRTMGWSQQSKDSYNKAKGSATPPPAPKLPAPTSSGGGSGSGGGSKPVAKPATKPTPAKLGNTSFERRTPNRAEFKGAQEYKASNPNAKPEDVLKAAQEAGKRQKSVDTDVAKFNKPEELNKPAPAGSALAAEQERRKAQAAATQKESYDAYDLVLEYLFDYGHANTIEEAEYIMTELDESFIQSLVETYEANVLAEEVTEWVNELVEEGYDLSEYTWDDMVDYYFSEGFEDTGYHDNYDPYSSRNGNQSRATSSRGRRIQKRVRELEASGDNEKANLIHKIASNRKNQEHGLAKQKRNNRRGPGPRRAKEDAMRDMRNSGF
jgi:hypothetical protein